MHPMPDRLNPSALRRLQLRLRPVLRQAGRQRQARQGQSSGHVGGDSPIQAEPPPSRDSWFAQRTHLGTPLSEAELEHGVAVGVISATLLT